MQNTHENDVSTQSDHQLATAPPPSGEPKRPRSHLHTGAILALALMLAVVFGTGLFALCEQGRSGNTAC